MDDPDMTNMPIQYLQIPPGLSQQDSRGNESFTNVYSFPPYPLTPYPTVPETGDWSPTPLEAWDNLVHTTEPEAKRRMTHFSTPSPSDLSHSSPISSLDVSSVELQRVLDSLLDQVDWLEVAVKVAEDRAPSIYCNAIEKILLAHIHQLVKAEDKGDDAVGFENDNDEKEYVYVYESDDEDEDEDRSEAPKESDDENGNGDEDEDEYKDDEEYMEGDEDENEEDNVYDSV